MSLPPRYDREQLVLPAQGVTTARLLLRPLSLNDWRSVWAMDSDPKVMRFIHLAATNADAHREDFLERFIQGDLRRYMYGIEWRDEPGMLGWALLRPTEDGQWIEVGYRLARKIWGHGIATEAARAMIDLAWDEWGVDEVMAVTHPDNRPSQNVLNKLGFTNCGLSTAFYDMRTTLFTLRKITDRAKAD